MKLQELIAKLQEIEKTNPGSAVVFNSAQVDVNSHTLRDVYLLDISPEDKNCLLVFGEYEHQAAEYKSQVETLRQQNIRP